MFTFLLGKYQTLFLNTFQLYIFHIYIMVRDKNTNLFNKQNTRAKKNIKCKIRFGKCICKTTVKKNMYERKIMYRC